MWGTCVKNGIATIDCIVPIFQSVVGAALALVGTTAVILILVASIKYITSGGGKAVDEAKNMVTYAIIGLIIVLVSFFVIGLISGFTGVKCIMTFGFGGC
ncbi:MAG TPA: hypothetical protein VF189_04695 [Patescibacteria group bacterium]